MTRPSPLIPLSAQFENPRVRILPRDLQRPHRDLPREARPRQESPFLHPNPGTGVVGWADRGRSGASAPAPRGGRLRFPRRRPRPRARHPAPRPSRQARLDRPGGLPALHQDFSPDAPRSGVADRAGFGQPPATTPIADRAAAQPVRRRPDQGGRAASGRSTARQHSPQPGLGRRIAREVVHAPPDKGSPASEGEMARQPPTMPSARLRCKLFRTAEIGPVHNSKRPFDSE